MSKDKDKVVLADLGSDEGFWYRFTDKGFYIGASFEGGYAASEVSLTKEQASLLRFHLGNWLLDQEKGE